MAALVFVDILAGILVILGFHIGFRKSFLRSLRTWRLRPTSPEVATASEFEELASVFRIVGVMLMAFSFTGACFANLIVYYSAGGPP
ncbi:hypothetical protein [Phenylobacterium sp.]|uniref:hypothetical protein n=1 Tax=Phenylobacterium sp. TaxID=1871053 RepID=UPI003BAB1A16